MRPTVRFPLAMLATAWGLAAPALAHESSREGPLTVRFAQCTEFVGLLPAEALKARALLPARYTLVSDASGARLVVRVVDCQSVRVGAQPARAARVAQVGLLIASPDGTATDPNTSINNYTLSYASNLPALVLGLRLAGVAAVPDADLAFEVTPPAGSSEFYAAVSPELSSGPTWFLHGTVNTPGFGTTFLANWWSDNGPRRVKMSTDIPAIDFDFASVMTLSTSRQNVIGGLIGANQTARFALTFRGAFANATMTVAPAP